MENKEGRKLLEHDRGPSEELFECSQTEQHICVLIAVPQWRGEIENAGEKGRSARMMSSSA